MSSLFDILVVFIILLTIGLILFSLGKGGAKEGEESPYASGEKFPPIKISYRTIRLFYAALFSVIDAAAILLAFMGGGYGGIQFLGFWLLLLFSILLLVKLRRREK